MISWGMVTPFSMPAPARDIQDISHFFPCTHHMFIPANRKNIYHLYHQQPLVQSENHEWTSPQNGITAPEKISLCEIILTLKK